jgi:hypothetical protein
MIQKKYSSKQLDCTQLKFLNADQIVMIDEALAVLGEFGELHLVVEKGRLRFLITQKSVDALQWFPGSNPPDGR